MNDLERFFGRLGEWIGALIAWLVALFQAVWASISEIAGSFFQGLAAGLGLQNAGPLTWLLLGVGLLMLIGGVRRLFAGNVVSAVIMAALGLGLIAWIAA
jgi:hypothetical protein